MILSLIEIVDNIAVVDSRRYCSEVIEVDHHDWMNNVVKTNQSAVEKRFGLLRFENAYVNIPNGGKKATKYAWLTEDQTSAFLVLSRNSAKVKEKKLDLIAEFARAKQYIKEQLERSLNLTVSDTPGYPYTLHQLWIDSGIVKKSQVREAITRDFLKDKHYQEEKGELRINETCYLILMLSFRSRQGVDTSKLPSILKISTEELYQYEKRKKANTRNSKPRGVSPGQMELF